MGAAAQLDSTPEAGISHTPDGPPSRRGGRRGGKAGILDQRGRLERSRQSARECRARKKLRYQYLEDLVKNKENAVFALRKELDQVTSSFILPKAWHFCHKSNFSLFPFYVTKMAHSIAGTNDS